MPRIACLLVPDFPVAAVCRANPDLASLPLALTDGDGPHAPIVATSKSARARGVKPGCQSATQARAVATDLVVRRRDPAAEDSTTRALLDVAASLASRIELAALRGDGCDVVRAGEELGYLAPLPLASLEPDAATAATVERWGARFFGDLARLPAAEVATRLGQPGVDLLRAARGKTRGRWRPCRRPTMSPKRSRWTIPSTTSSPSSSCCAGSPSGPSTGSGSTASAAGGSPWCSTWTTAAATPARCRWPHPRATRRRSSTCLRVALEATPPRAAVLQATVLAVPERVRLTQVHDANVHDAWLRADGERVVTASADRTVRIWNAATGAAIGPPLRHDAQCRTARFVPARDRVVALCGAVVLWDVGSDERPATVIARDAQLATALSLRRRRGGSRMLAPAEWAAQAAAAREDGAVTSPR